MWRDFFDSVKDANCPIISAYALTAYKSQGSTYENIFVDTTDFYKNYIENNNFLRNRALYTAVSRASKNIFLLVNFQHPINPRHITEKIFRPCSRCRSKRELHCFIRRSGKTRATCNMCYISSKSKRQSS